MVIIPLDRTTGTRGPAGPAEHPLAGLIRSKNTVNILFKSLIDFVFATLAFWAIGYAFMFGSTAGGFIGTSGFLLDPTCAPDVFGLPVMSFWLFQLVLA